jgi:hypothetical protein
MSKTRDDDDEPEDTKSNPEPLVEKSAKDRTRVAAQHELEEKRKAQVGSEVMALLGAPPDFARVDARRVGAGRYRVNVRVELPSEQQLVQETRIAHSYFVDVDAAGNVLSSMPAIKKLYEVVCFDCRPLT